MLSAIAPKMMPKKLIYGIKANEIARIPKTRVLFDILRSTGSVTTGAPYCC